jgi:hypothetical protein
LHLIIVAKQNNFMGTDVLLKIS